MIPTADLFRTSDANSLDVTIMPLDVVPGHGPAAAERCDLATFLADESVSI